MARTADEVIVEVRARTAAAEQSLNRYGRTFDRTMSQSSRALEIHERQVKATTANISASLAGAAVGLAAAFSTTAVIQYADAYTGLQNRLRAAGLEGTALTRVEDQLYAAANRNGVAVQATAELYQRATMARENLGASEAQLMTLVEGTTAALKVQGTSTTEASGALLQLGQILGGANVQAEEYNSLIDGLPTLLQAVADGSDRWGGSVARLTQDVKSGKVTSQEFFQAALKGFGEIQAKADGAATTIGAALQVLNDNLGRYVGQSDQGLSATARMAQGIQGLANNLDTIIPVIGTLTTLVGVRWVWALTASASAMAAQGIAAVRLAGFQTAMTASMTGTTSATLLATTATRGFTAALAANPIGAVLVAVTALAAGIYLLSQRYSESAALQREIDSTATAASQALDEYEQAAAAAAAATGKNAAEARANAAAMRQEAIDAVRAAQALRERTAALAAERAQAAQAAEAQFFRSMAGGGRGATEARGGEMAAAQSRARIAERQAADAARAAEQAQGRLTRIQQNATASPTPAPVRTGRGGGGASPGPSANQIAEARQRLELEEAMARARATGDAATIRAEEERQRIIELTAQYRAAGDADAENSAINRVALENQALQVVEDRERAEAATSKQVEANARAMAESAEQQERMAEAAQDQLRLEADLAQLRGDPAALAAVERRLFIDQETNRLLEQRLGLTEAQAKAEASQRYDELQAAEIIGGLGQSDPASAAAAMYGEVERLRQQDLLSEEQAAQRRAQINAEYNEARLQSTRSMLEALAGFQNSSNKKLAAIGKAAAISQATIDGYLAVQKALASAPPPFNFVQAAIVGAAAAANVAGIAGMKDGGRVTGVGGPRQDNQIRALSVGEFVTNEQATRRNLPWLEAMNSGARFEDLAAKINGLADGGLVGRVGRLPELVMRPRAAGASLSYAPTIDARGADVGMLRRIEQTLADDRASLEGRVTDIVSRAEKYRLGTNRRRR